jgi:hypothetical protein
VKDRALTRRATGRAEIRQQDACRFLSGLAPASADLLLTDPPDWSLRASSIRR